MNIWCIKCNLKQELSVCLIKIKMLFNEENEEINHLLYRIEKLIHLNLEDIEKYVHKLEKENEKLEFYKNLPQHIKEQIEACEILNKLTE